ncbi:hypothetical protein ACI65C_013482 [Semiaphis heraclei]
MNFQFKIICSFSLFLRILSIFELKMLIKKNIVGALYTIDGRRVIDIGYVFGKIANIRHKPFDCTFSDLVLTGERKIGWYSEFHFTCGVCKIKETVESEDPHKSSMQVNLAAVTGSINAGQGYSQLYILTAVLNMPNMSNCLYQKLHEKVYDFTNATAWESMSDNKYKTVQYKTVSKQFFDFERSED